jgi:hypothetical protein
MFNLFNGLPRPSPGLAETPDRPALPPRPAESPGFLQAGFAPFEPDLTHEIRQALGEQAARRAGDMP